MLSSDSDKAPGHTGDILVEVADRPLNIPGWPSGVRPGLETKQAGVSRAAVAGVKGAPTSSCREPTKKANSTRKVLRAWSTMG